MPEEDRATDIGNMHKNLVKIARVVPKVSSRTDRQTDRQTYSSQYFATAPAGEVKIQRIQLLFQHAAEKFANRKRQPIMSTENMVEVWFKAS